MGGRKVRRAIRIPQATNDSRVLSTLDQIQQHYGGRARTEGAIKDAAELARQLNVIHDPAYVGPGGYRDYFPEIDYDRYRDDLLVNPVPAEIVNDSGSLPRGEPDGGVLMPPMRTNRLGNQIQMRTGEFIAAPDEAMDMPSISYSQDMPFKMPMIANSDKLNMDIMDMSPEDLDLMADFKRRSDEALRLGSVARSVEMPMTEYVTNAYERQAGDASLAKVIGPLFDETLAQIRRASGKAFLQPDQARRLIGDALERSVLRDKDGNVVGRGFLGRNEVDSETGLTMDRLAVLAALPPAIRAFLPQRIRELLTLGGVTTGLLGAGGSSDRESIGSSSTTGPLSGLIDY